MDRTAEMNLDYAGVLSRANSQHGSCITNLKGKQKEVLCEANIRDVIAILPTGYGKTAIFQMLPYLDPLKTGCILVANPLNAIIQQQEEILGKAAVVLNSVCLAALASESCDPQVNEVVHRLKAGNVQFIVGHPELLTDPISKKLFMAQALGKKAG